MLDAYDGAALHPRSKPAFRDERGQFVCIDATGADPKPTDCLYHFNSLGYRSEEFDPTARLKIFVSGCSYTFGLGMEPDQAWPGLLKKMVADKLGVPLDRANLQNFSQVGASNDYIARTIVRQCERVRPDLAVIAFTHRERAEYLSPGVTRNLGLWDLDHPEEWAAPAIRYFSMLTEEAASLDLLRNMLLVQWAMARRRIPYLMLWMNRTPLDRPPVTELEPLRQLRDMVDPARWSPRCLLEPGIHVESNLVDRHPGPMSHANFAPLVVEALDLSAPPPVPVRPRPGETPRILVLGDFPATTSDPADCTGDRCHCRRMAVRYGLGDAAADRPLPANASNDRILRTLLAHCRHRKPDFVFVGFSAARSCEHFQDGALVELDRTSCPPPQLATLTETWRQHVTDELHDRNALQNILMAQEFLETERVPYIMSIPPALRWRNMDVSATHPVLRTYASLVIPSSLCNRRPRRVEPAGHPGEDPPRRRPFEMTRDFVSRLKKRFVKSRTEDPNLYPMW